MKKHTITVMVVALLSVIVLVGATACAKPAEFRVTSLDISPPEVIAGGLITITAEVKNVGGSEGTYTAILKINGAEVETKDILVAAGGTETIPFEVTEDSPGTYTVSLDGLTATFGVWAELIAFESDRDGDREIYVMNADGSNVVKLTNNTAWDDNPSWSPDGKKIAFDSDRDGDREIYVMNADGSNVVKLTNNSIVDLQPSWSPDGNKIAFRSGTSVNDTGIYVMNADGTNCICLTEPHAFISKQAWSPDGSEIVFCLIVDGRGEIYVMNSANGLNKRRLIEPAWSRDKKMHDGSPAWSPVGDKLVFYSFRHGFIEESPGGYSVTGEIFVMHANGSNLVRLTFDPYALDIDSVWSPDGEKIVFVSERDGDEEIYIMNSDGSNLVKLTDNVAEDDSPSWALVGK